MHDQVVKQQIVAKFGFTSFKSLLLKCLISENCRFFRIKLRKMILYLGVKVGNNNYVCA